MQREMRVLSISEFGGRGVLQLTTRSVPEVSAGEVLVHVRAIGVNPVDWKTRSGAGVAGTIRGFPFVPGWDIAGTITRVGAGVIRLNPGDRVMGMVNFPSGGGGYAEFVCAAEEELTPIDDAVSFTAAAAVPLCALTAWQALFSVAGLSADQRVLIHAAAGGVGHLAVQLARWKGAYVIGTASRANHEILHSLGCDEVYSYRANDPWLHIPAVDVVLDPIGGQTRERSLDLLNPEGTLVTLVTGESSTGLDSPAVRKILVESNEIQLEQISHLLSSGELNVRTTVLNGLERIPETHALSEAGHVVGKLVVVP